MSFFLLKKKGEGTFAVVYKAKQLLCCENYGNCSCVLPKTRICAIKMFKPSDETSKSKINSHDVDSSNDVIKDEKRLYSALGKVEGIPYIEEIITLDDIRNVSLLPLNMRISSVTGFVFEYFNTTLLELCSVNRPFFSVIKNLRSVMLNLLIDLKKIHGKGIIHCDLKPDNIILNVSNDWRPSSKLMITDFGNSILEKESVKYMRDSLCTLAHRAPERFYIAPFDAKIDVYSMGCTFYYMITKNHLFWNPSVTKQENIKNGIKSRMNYADRLKCIKHTNLKDLLHKMLQFVPNKRYTVDNCLNHDFFRPRTVSQRMDDIQHLKKTSVKRLFPFRYNEEDFRRVKKRKLE